MAALRRRRAFSFGLSIIGVAALCYLGGAAAIYFDLPSSGLLRKAFGGATQWRRRPAASPGVQDSQPQATILGDTGNEARNAFEGFTLYACATSKPVPTQAFLIDMRGMCQRLPNGNTLIVSSEDGKIVEVTPAKNVAWSTVVRGVVTSARRYAADQLPFLQGAELTPSE